MIHQMDAHKVALTQCAYNYVLEHTQLIHQQFQHNYGSFQILLILHDDAMILNVIHKYLKVVQKY